MWYSYSVTYSAPNISKESVLQLYSMLGSDQRLRGRVLQKNILFATRTQLHKISRSRAYTVAFMLVVQVTWEC